MNKSDLISLGFNHNEAVVYLIMIKLVTANANTIIKETGFHKNIVYDNLDKLLNKGLINYIISEGKRVYSLSSSDMLVELFEDQEKSIAQKKDLALRLSKEIERSKISVPIKHEASISQGIKSIKSFYNESLKGPDYVVFGAPKASVDVMGEHFWKNYNLKLVEKKIRIRMIFNQSLRQFGSEFNNKYTQIKYFDKEFEPLTETHIQGDRVGIIVWTENPTIFLIENRFVAENYLKFFQGMWKKSLD